MLWPQYIVRTHRSRENIFIWRNNCESDYMCSSSSSRSSNIPTIMVVLLLPTSLSIIEWPEWPRFSYISNIVIFSNNRLQNPTSVKIFSVALRLLWPLPTTNCGSSTGSDGSKFFYKVLSGKPGYFTTWPVQGAHQTTHDLLTEGVFNAAIIWWICEAVVADWYQFIVVYSHKLLEDTCCKIFFIV